MLATIGSSSHRWRQARDAVGKDKLTVVADRGYFKDEEIVDCEQSGIKTLVPKPQTSPNKAVGLFDKADFRYSLLLQRVAAMLGVCLPAPRPPAYSSSIAGRPNLRLTATTLVCSPSNFLASGKA
jgi:hypothetical protein